MFCEVHNVTYCGEIKEEKGKMSSGICRWKLLISNLPFISELLITLGRSSQEEAERQSG